MPVKAKAKPVHRIIVEKIKELHKDIWEMGDYDVSSMDTHAISVLCDVLVEIGVPKYEHDWVIRNLAKVRLPKGIDPEAFICVPYDMINETIKKLREQK